MQTALIADIGGTNSRLATVGADGRPEHVIKLRGDEVSSLEAAIARYLDETGAKPRVCVLAIAGPIEGDAIVMTNRPWRFRLSEIAKKFGWHQVRAVNDFEALAWGLQRLAEGDVHPLGPVLPAAPGNRAVFGPGTGLGVAALVRSGAGWQAVATEGGHVSFGSAEADEDAIFADLRAQCGFVSAESVLSGPGLERLYRAMHGDDRSPTAAEIIAGAHAGDRQARATIMLFVRLLGRFAGDLALIFKALGGVYVAGGVARRIGSLLETPAFRSEFEHHPPYGDLLKAIPTTLITFDEPGLLGCAALAEAMLAETA